MTPSTLRLKQLAEAATPGPWRWMSRNALVGNHGNRPVVLTSPCRLEIRHKESGLLVELTPSWSDPAYIAAANPEAVLGLIARIEKLEAALQFYAGTDCYAVVCDDGSVDGHSEEVPGTIAREALKEET